jgi:hypothetical protein
LIFLNILFMVVFSTTTPMFHSLAPIRAHDTHFDAERRGPSQRIIQDGVVTVIRGSRRKRQDVNGDARVRPIDQVHQLFLVSKRFVEDSAHFHTGARSGTRRGLKSGIRRFLSERVYELESERRPKKGEKIDSWNRSIYA